MLIKITNEKGNTLLSAFCRAYKSRDDSEKTNLRIADFDGWFDLDIDYETFELIIADSYKKREIADLTEERLAEIKRVRKNNPYYNPASNKLRM